MSLKFNPITGEFNQVANITAAENVISSQKLQIEKIASIDIPVGCLIKMDDKDNCSPAGVSNEASASVVGICTDSVLAGELTTILLLGVFEDASLVSIPFGASLFQDNQGNITQNATSIVGEFYTRVGKSFGNGIVLIKPEEPVEVT